MTTKAAARPTAAQTRSQSRAPSLQQRGPNFGRVNSAAQAQRVDITTARNRYEHAERMYRETLAKYGYL